MCGGKVVALNVIVAEAKWFSVINSANALLAPLQSRTCTSLSLQSKESISALLWFTEDFVVPSCAILVLSGCRKKYHELTKPPHFIWRCSVWWSLKYKLKSELNRCELLLWKQD